MKTTLAIVLADLAGGQDTQGIVAARRASQLEEMMRFFNPSFMKWKHHAYGCNCNLYFGDRPLSQPPLGQPIDALDMACRNYKHCVQCVTNAFGNGCIGELITYDFTMPDGPKCGDIQNTCGRALCECDKQFATEHNEHKDVYNQDFSYIISGFNSQEICPNICNSNLISLTDTSQYFNNTEETMDGHFTADHELVNGHKCYRRTDEPNTVMVWEVDVYGSGAWVIRNTVGTRFFSTDDIPCPNSAEWIFLPDGLDTIIENFVPAGGLGFNGKVPGEAKTSPAADLRCCTPKDTYFQLYNDNTHNCCSNGAVVLETEPC